ncbi:MAG TPA: hypothetical protein VHD32_12705 [Candidatus Didemnitutus sp.]|nr:hypothetical protein [Candidatus Didemnitutus sp.]
MNSKKTLSLLLAVSAVLAFPPSSGAATDSAPKTHTLFMGVDLTVEYQGKMYPVRDVAGDNFVISVDGKNVEVRARYGPVKIKIERALKISGVTATVAEMKTDRVYTPGNDPGRRMIEAQSQVIASQQAVASAAAVYAGAQIQAHALGRSMQHGDAGMPALGPSPADAEHSLSVAGANANGSYTQADSLSSESRREAAEGMYDAIDVSFQIGSEQVVAYPYVIALVEFHAPDAKPGAEQNWVYAKALSPLEAKTHHVTIHEGGFPPGYVIDSCQLHIFDRGREIASTVSDNQVRLTSKETFAYLLLNYLGSHKGETLTARPAMGKPAPEVAAQLAPADLSRTYYVKVAADGNPEGTFEDANLRTPAGGAMAPVLGGVRYYPELKNGRAVEGVAEVRLSSLAL